MRKKSCHACPFTKEVKTIKKNNFTWKINTKVNCETRNVVYMIECNLDKCRKRYIGETERQLKERLTEHKTYINNKMLNKPTGEHFNLPGHSISDMEGLVIEQVNNKDPFILEDK